MPKIYFLELVFGNQMKPTLVIVSQIFLIRLFHPIFKYESKVEKFTFTFNCLLLTQWCIRRLICISTSLGLHYPFSLPPMASILLLLFLFLSFSARCFWPSSFCCCSYLFLIMWPVKFHLRLFTSLLNGCQLSSLSLINLLY